MTLRNAMSSIANIDFSDESWTQASLPVRSGGLGIRKASDISLPCFISSALLASSLVDAILSSVPNLAPFKVSTEMELWKTKGQGRIEHEGESGFRQRAWDTPYIEFVKKNCSRLQISSPEYGYWLHHSLNLVPGSQPSQFPALGYKCAQMNCV